MGYEPAASRYETMSYRACARSGLALPRLSLGLWHNFGHASGPKHEVAKELCFRAFDAGVTHFDLANNYGPPPGAAEAFMGRLLKHDLAGYRDELVISTKAGWRMWPGPYGDWGSRKYLIASLDQSLRRMGLEYVDIYYHHRPDPNTPLEETMAALDQVVRQGKALYVGISAYDGEDTRRACQLLRAQGTPFVLHQVCYNMFERTPETDLFPVLKELGVSAIGFCPLAQGVLSERYLEGVPDDSRAADPEGYLDVAELNRERLDRVRALKTIAAERGQTIAQLALAWALRIPEMASVIVGASRVSQLVQNLAALDRLKFTAAELQAIETILDGSGVGSA